MATSTHGQEAPRPDTVGAAPTGEPASASQPVGEARGRRSLPPWFPVPFLVVVIAFVQLTLPPSVTLGPIWLIPAIELIGIPLTWAIWHWSQMDGFPLTDEVLDRLMAAYLCFLTAASCMNAALLLTTLLSKTGDTPGRLLLAGFSVLAINVLTFGLIYWWLDGGGPRRRALGEVGAADFQFPQQSAGQQWKPAMVDYLYTAYTNTIAFSPTDTMPLTHRVKVLFTVQSAISLVTVLVTVSRAINMLPM
jgi:hypothetical protein